MPAVLSRGAPCLAALDVGATSVKACLFSPSLRLLACHVEEYALDARGERVEAGAERYLEAARRGLGAVLKAAPGFRPAALGLTTQGETLVPVDAAGRPLRPCLVWLDGRAQAQAETLARELDGQRFYETTGLPQMDGALPLAKALWLAQNEPDVLARAHKLLLLEDYFLWKLTGRFATEPSLQTSTGWYDIRRDGYWPQALALAGLRADQLPELLACGQRAGGLTAEAARFLGLPQGLPVVAGAMDQTAAALAAGSDRPGAVTETTGTALVMTACTDAPVFPRQRRVTVYRHALPGQYLYLPIGKTAGMALRWFRDAFCPDLPAGSDGFAALDQEVAALPLGSEGVAFLPFLAGARDQDACPGARGVFYGGRLSAARAHFARSVMESTACMIRDFLEDLRGLGCPVQDIRALGGGARSPVWLQIKADICGRVFRVPACTEAAAQGAALLAGWGSGLIPRGEKPADGEETAFLPDPSRAADGERAYALYRRLYDTLRPLFDRAPESAPGPDIPE